MHSSFDCYFETTPEEVDRLIEEMKLTGGPVVVTGGPFDMPSLKQYSFEGIAPETWKDPMYFSRYDGGWILITNGEKTKVYMQECQARHRRPIHPTPVPWVRRAQDHEQLVHHPSECLRQSD